ncbi:unnamed protein product, partial [marine sediment metagenome]
EIKYKQDKGPYTFYYSTIDLYNFTFRSFKSFRYDRFGKKLINLYHIDADDPLFEEIMILRKVDDSVDIEKATKEEEIFLCTFLGE